MFNSDGPILISSEDKEYQDILAALDFNMIHDATPTSFQDSFIGGAASLGVRSEDGWVILNRTGSPEPMSGIEGEPSDSVWEVSNDIPMCEKSPSFLPAKDTPLPQNRRVEPSSSGGQVEDRIGLPQNQDDVSRAEINNVDNIPPNPASVPPDVPVGRDSREIIHELASKLVPLIRELIEHPGASGDAEVGTVQTSDLVNVPCTRYWSMKI